MGSPAEDLAITARLAAFTGRKVCVPAYRLAPEHPFPAQREDALAVHRALIDGGKQSIAMAGESAGGNLALTVINAIASAGLPMPVAAALLSPWSDLAHRGDTIDARWHRPDAERPVGPQHGACLRRRAVAR
jgi:acetyl esterase/lipase